MDILNEIRHLMEVDPEGWAYGWESRLDEVAFPLIRQTLSYREDRIMLHFGYKSLLDPEVAPISIWTERPTIHYFSWWERKRFIQMQRDMGSRLIRGMRNKVENRLLGEHDPLADAFAVLEAEDRREQQRIREAPVSTGFMRGITNRLGQK